MMDAKTFSFTLLFDAKTFFASPKYKQQHKAILVSEKFIWIVYAYNKLILLLYNLNEILLTQKKMKFVNEINSKKYIFRENLEI